MVISLGGSIFVPGEGEGVEHIRALAAVLLECTSAGVRLLVSVGGGETARRYIAWGRELGGDEFTLDEMGISLTRVNAALLLVALRGGDVAPRVMQGISDAAGASHLHGIVVMGGTHPGHTTDAVAAMLAERVQAVRVVNATSVDGVYDSDPERNPDARMFERLSYEELLALISSAGKRAGSHHPFDALGVRTLMRSRRPLAIVNGRSLPDLAAAILGKGFRGTVVV